MDSCDANLAVSGNALAATAFWQSGRPYLAWVATDWQGDREDRVKHFPVVRRMLDRYVNGPIIRRLEKKLLASAPVLSLSEYTADMLARIAGPQFQRVILPVPVDADLFVPDPAAVVPGRLGFAGRFNDPRKNIRMLLLALAQLRSAGHEASVVLMGDTAEPAVDAMIGALGLKEFVSIKARLSRSEMRDCMQTLDLFVLPSHQEGLCISALEAMACGVPVVSTRCGGPEEFVMPGVTGTLVDFSPGEMAEAIAAIVNSRQLRQKMSRAARALVQERYTTARADAIFMQAFKSAFPQLGRQRAAADVHANALAANERAALTP
jgi:glycosyltransferase involved in cell wall biosynthesis